MAKTYEPTNESGQKLAWECSVCGHIEKGYPEGLPKDYICPVCGAKAKKFKAVYIDY